MRPLGHLPLVSRVQPSKGGCSLSRNCSLILLPHQSRWWICGDQRRGDGLGSFHHHWAPCSTVAVHPQPGLSLAICAALGKKDGQDISRDSFQAIPGELVVTAGMHHLQCCQIRPCQNLYPPSAVFLLDNSKMWWPVLVMTPVLVRRCWCIMAVSSAEERIAHKGNVSCEEHGELPTRQSWMSALLVSTGMHCSRLVP